MTITHEDEDFIDQFSNKKLGKELSEIIDEIYVDFRSQNLASQIREVLKKHNIYEEKLSYSSKRNND